MTSSRRCTATTASGTQCRAWAVPGSDPPRCGAHRGGTHPPGAPAGNSNALTHGFYSHSNPPAQITAVIEDLIAKQKALSDYIDTRLNEEKTTVESLAHLLALHGQNASRLGRLLRDQRALSGEAADGIAGAIAQALDELSNELGAPL